jgi:CheY-like chemotaxis protein
MAKKWILLVDDDPTVLAVLEAALEHPDLNVTTASDALQAFIQARELKPFLIISDIKMPGYGDGTTTLKRLREDPRVPACPIIFITAMELEEARRLLPANDPLIGLMRKPLELKVLREYVWKLATARPTGAGA